MRNRTFHLLLPGAFLAFGLLACSGGDAGQETEMEAAPEVAPAETGPTVVASDLNGPMGVLVDDDGTLWIAEAGLAGDNTIIMPSMEDFSPTEMAWGNTARVSRVTPDGTQSEMGILPSLHFGEGPEGANRIAIVDGDVYVTNLAWMEGANVDRMPNWAAVVRLDDGEFTEVANTWDVEEANNPEGALVESHPYGITAGPDGMLWVADAAGNTLLRVDPAMGSVEVEAVFGPYDGPIPNPARDNRNEIEAVPTAVAFQDDNTYVSLLTGIPFIPGLSRVVQVHDDGTYEDYATGLTMLTDLRAAPDGNLYAVSMGVFTEEGPQPESGALMRIMPGDSTSEAVISGLTFPTSVAFDAEGNAYITINGVGAPGSGQVMKYPGIAPPGM
jgi:sugar lactone lactonase YvrE